VGEWTEDEVEGGPVGELGTLKGNSMAVEHHLEDGTAEEERGVATRRVGGRKRMKRRLITMGTGPTKGIWPMAISTEVAAAAATCTEAQAFKEMELVVSVVKCSHM
jgi:hypothetical protein